MFGHNISEQEDISLDIFISDFKLRGSGLLMQTQASGISEEEPQVLSQFVHLSIQEFLAMAGLLKESPDQVRKTLKRLAKSEQFNMALLFLYGLAFNSNNETVREISTAVGGQLPQRKELQQLLLEAVGVGNKSRFRRLPNRPVNSPGFSLSLTDFGLISRPNSYVSKTKKLDTVLNLTDFNISMLTGLS